MYPQLAKTHARVKKLRLEITHCQIWIVYSLPNMYLSVLFSRMALRTNFENSNEVGAFAKLTNKYCLVGVGANENFYRSVFESVRAAQPSHLKTLLNFSKLPDFEFWHKNFLVHSKPSCPTQCLLFTPQSMDVALLVVWLLATERVSSFHRIQLIKSYRFVVICCFQL